MADQNLAWARSQALPGNVIKGGSASRQTVRQQPTIRALQGSAL